MEVKEDGKTLAIADAIPGAGPDDTILLASQVGLRAYDPSTQALSHVDIPEPPQPAATLVRDGLKRLWIGNDKGLWLAEPGAKAPEAFDRMPWVSRGQVEAIAPDPQHTDGVIVALGSRGVAFVRVRQKP